MGNLTPVTTTRRLGLAAGVPIGVAFLGLLVFFAVLLPRLSEDDAVALPDALPGGWIAADLAPAVDADDADAAARERFTDYVREVYTEVYDEPVAFRAYTVKDLSAFIVITVFTSEGGAFGPPNGVADPEALELKRAPIQLVRRGDVVCMANYRAVAEGEEDTEGSEVPTSVGCQLPVGGHTIQVSSNGNISLDATIKLAHDVADRI